MCLGHNRRGRAMGLQHQNYLKIPFPSSIPFYLHTELFRPNLLLISLVLVTIFGSLYLLFIVSLPWRLLEMIFADIWCSRGSFNLRWLDFTVHFWFIAQVGRLQTTRFITSIFGCHIRAIVVNPDQACIISCICLNYGTGTFIYSLSRGVQFTNTFALFLITFRMGAGWGSLSKLWSFRT